MALTDETKLNRTSAVRPEHTTDPPKGVCGMAAGASCLLERVSEGLPALAEAQRVSELAAGEGFEWDSVGAVWAQVAEERAEFEREARGSEGAALEFGDLLFALVNVARHEGIEAEDALRASTAKFRRRWATMELLARERGTSLEELSTEEQNVLWREAKSRERLMADAETQALATGGGA